MCDVCLRSIGHDPRCPNYRPAQVGKCPICGDVIYEGDEIVRIYHKYTRTDGKVVRNDRHIAVHKECAYEPDNRDELLALCEIELKTDYAKGE